MGAPVPSPPPPNAGSSPPAPPRMRRWRIVTCALAMCGIQVCYSAQINMGTSQLLLLGMSERAVSLAWLAGPLSGLIVQPIVGHFSDRCASPLGRRRPFLIAGTVLTSAALLLFSNASSIASLLVGKSDASSAALPIAVCAFFLLDFSIQAIQAPLRALVTDVVPKPQRATGNSYVGVFSGLGNLLGSLLTAARLSAILPFFASDVQALFAIAAIVLTITVLICVVATREEPLEALDYARVATEADATQRVSQALPVTALDESTSEDALALPPPLSAHPQQPVRRSFAQSLRGIPRPFWRVFCVQLCTWCGFFTLFVYINAWVGKNVFLGDGTAPADSPQRETFEEGVRLGGKGNAMTALVTLLYSLALPGLLKRFGVVSLYAFGQLVEAFSLMLTPLIRGKPGREPSAALRAITVADIGLFGIVWGTTMGVPWTLIGNALESDERYARRIGLFQTIFNASQSGPQLIVGFAAPFILAASQDDPAAVMFVGGVCAIIGAAVILVLRVGDEDDIQRVRRSCDTEETEDVELKDRTEASSSADTLQPQAQLA